MESVRRLLRWLERAWYGEDQIAVEIEGEEAISEEEWEKLPAEEQERWRRHATRLLHRRKKS